jgi:hypothetical protein
MQVGGQTGNIDNKQLANLKEKNTTFWRVCSEKRSEFCEYFLVTFVINGRIIELLLDCKKISLRSIWPNLHYIPRRIRGRIK